MITNGSSSARVPAAEGHFPSDSTPVLLNRPLRPDARNWESRFGDARWDVTPGLFEEHATGSSIPWDTFPQRWVPSVKRYLWHLINGEEVGGLTSSNVDRLGLRTIVQMTARVRMILEWVDAAGLHELSEFGPEKQELFLQHVLELEGPHKHKQQLLSEFRRLWTYRHIVEAPLQMPAFAPWGGEGSVDLVGPSTKVTENLTARISDTTLQPLLVWAFRFVDDFAGDITVAQRAWVEFDKNRPARRERMIRQGNGSVRLRVEALISEFRRQGRPLPGRERDGQVTPDLRHIASLVGCRTLEIYRDLLLTSGLPIEIGALAIRNATGRLDEQSWAPGGIDYRDAPSLARHLSAACFIVISYLSGMRPGEVLNLRRGCASTNKRTGISTIRGKHFKSVRLPDGSANPEGEIRRDPWVVHESVVRAVHALEKLHDGDLLFPASLMPGRLGQSSAAAEGDSRRTQGGRSGTALNADIAAFSRWVNDYCAANGRLDAIPNDRRGAISGGRFRRTLAWHIVRQPRGLIAAAIQYGHVHVAITQGYGGGADSGFADEVAFESWLLKLETIAREQTQIDHGTLVSGPAASEFKRRISDGERRFAGRIHLTVRQAQKALEHPSLQVFEGRGMHCVMTAAKAACQVAPDGRSNTMTPDIEDCRPYCQNIARTDADVEQLRDAAGRLEEVANDVLAPPIRTARERAEAARLRALIAEHERGRK